VFNAQIDPNFPTETNSLIRTAIGGSGDDVFHAKPGRRHVHRRWRSQQFFFSPGGGANAITDFNTARDQIDLADYSTTLPRVFGCSRDREPERRQHIHQLQWR